MPFGNSYSYTNKSKAKWFGLDFDDVDSQAPKSNEFFRSTGGHQEFLSLPTRPVPDCSFNDLVAIPTNKVNTMVCLFESKFPGKSTEVLPRPLQFTASSSRTKRSSVAIQTDQSGLERLTNPKRLYDKTTTASDRLSNPSTESIAKIKSHHLPNKINGKNDRSLRPSVGKERKEEIQIENHTPESHTPESMASDLEKWTELIGSSSYCEQCGSSIQVHPEQQKMSLLGEFSTLLSPPSSSSCARIRLIIPIGQKSQSTILIRIEKKNVPKLLEQIKAIIENNGVNIDYEFRRDSERRQRCSNKKRFGHGIRKRPSLLSRKSTNKSGSSSRSTDDDDEWSSIEDDGDQRSNHSEQAQDQTTDIGRDGPASTLKLRSSWRRQNFYKRRESLDDYLTRNLYPTSPIDMNGEPAHQKQRRSGQRLINFKINQPWLKYVRKNNLQLQGKQVDLNSLNDSQKKLFESLFEIIITEKSYLGELDRALQLKEEIPRLVEILSKSEYDRKILFGKLESIREVNSKLYEELEIHFQRDRSMSQMLPILSEHLQLEYFQPYIEYIRQQGDREILIVKLNAEIPEMDAKMMSSLFITPLQHIPRYPLLLNNVIGNIKRLQKRPLDLTIGQIVLDIETFFRDATECYQKAEMLSKACDDELKTLEKLKELILFKQRLIKCPIANFVMKGRELISQAEIKITKHSDVGDRREPPKIKLQHNYKLVLLTDYLMLLRKRNKKFLVIECEKLHQVSFEGGRCGDVTDSVNQNSRTPETPKDPLNKITFNKTEVIDLYYFTFFNNNDLEKFAQNFRGLRLAEKHNNVEENSNGIIISQWNGSIDQSFKSTAAIC